YRKNIAIKNPFNKDPNNKGFNIAPFLNRTGFQTVDAPDYWRERMGLNGWQGRGGVRGALGKTGGALFGRKGRDLVMQRGFQRVDHARKLAEQNPMRYHAS